MQERGNLVGTAAGKIKKVFSLIWLNMKSLLKSIQGTVDITISSSSCPVVMISEFSKSADSRSLACSAVNVSTFFTDSFIMVSLISFTVLQTGVTAGFRNFTESLILWCVICESHPCLDHMSTA